MTHTVTLTPEQKFRARLLDLGARMLDTEWHGRLADYRVRCKNGHESTPSAHNVLAGQGVCRKCSAAAQSTAAIKRFHDYVTTHGGHLADPDTWNGVRIGHDVVCAQGHTFRIRPHGAEARSAFCLTCTGRPHHKRERRGFDRFKQVVAERGGTVLEPDYRGVHQPHAVRCSQGHLIHPIPNNLYRRPNLCGICSQQARRKDPGP